MTTTTWMTLRCTNVTSSNCPNHCYRCFLASPTSSTSFGIRDVERCETTKKNGLVELRVNSGFGIRSAAKGPYYLYLPSNRGLSLTNDIVVSEPSDAVEMVSPSELPI
jgi:hypothetical protein